VGGQEGTLDLYWEATMRGGCRYLMMRLSYVCIDRMLELVLK